MHSSCPLAYEFKRVQAQDILGKVLLNADQFCYILYYLPLFRHASIISHQMTKKKKNPEIFSNIREGERQRHFIVAEET